MKIVFNAFVLFFSLSVFPSQAATLDPFGFTSLGTLDTVAPLSINTDTLQMMGGASYTGVLDQDSGEAIFTFDSIKGTDVSIFGSRSLGLLSRSDIAFGGLINVLGSGGIDIVASGSMTVTNLNSMSPISLVTGNQMNIQGVISGGPAPISLNSTGNINILYPLQDVSVIATHEGVRRDIISLGNLTMTTRIGTGTLGSGFITLTGGTISGQLSVLNSGGIAVSSGVDLVAPVPIPGALCLFASGLGVLGLIKRRVPSLR